MKRAAWIRRLDAQLPGWHVWHSSPGMPGKWNAVPAPAAASHIEALALPSFRLTRISAESPAELRRLARVRYGWDDHCQTCGVLARECGHRCDETKQRRG